MGFRRAVIVVAVLALLTASLLMAAASAQASSPPSGQIAFVRDGNIWAIATNGTGERQLTVSGVDSSPTWSPDGNRIAFLRWGEIWTMDSDGGNARSVAFTLGPEQMPWHLSGNVSYYVTTIAWSPDGANIAVGAYAFDQGDTMADSDWATRLFLVHPDGTGQQAISDVQPYAVGMPYYYFVRLSWRPDGKAILATGYCRGTMGLLHFDIASRKFVDAFPQQHPGYGAWSPDGTHIAATLPDEPGIPSRSRLAIYDVQTLSKRSLLHSTGGSRSEFYPSWSLDGSWIACAEVRLDGPTRSLMLVPAAGGEPDLLTTNAGEPAWSPTSSPTAPLVVLIGGLSSKIPASGGDWTFVKQRLEKAGFKGRVFVAKTHPGLPPGDASDVIDSESPDWRDSAARLDHQLSAAGYRNRDLVLVGHSLGGLIARVYAANWEIPGSGCRPLGIVQLGTPNKGSEAANLAIGPLHSEAADRLADDASMAAFNDEFPNAEALPIYRIAGSYFPKSAGAYVAKQVLTPKKQNLLAAVLGTIVGVYGTAYNDSVVTVDSVRGGPTAGWKGCTVYRAVHANSKWLLSFRDDCGCVLPRRSGKKGAAAIDEKIMKKIIEDVRGVEKSSSAAHALPSRADAAVRALVAGSAH